MNTKKQPAVAGPVEPTVRPRDCEHCGCIFIGSPEHGICDDCSATYREAMRQEERRAEWHAEMRRDAFGA